MGVSLLPNRGSTIGKEKGEGTMNSLLKIDRNGIRKFVREDRYAVTAAQNFLSAFGVWLAEQHGAEQSDIIEAFEQMNEYMGRDDNIQRLEEIAGIRLDAKR